MICSERGWTSQDDHYWSQGKSLHEEELTLSKVERDVHHRIKTNAPHQQCHPASNKLAKTTNQAAATAAASNPPHTATGKHKTPSQDTTSMIQKVRLVLYNGYDLTVSKSANEKKARLSLLRIKVTYSQC